MGDLWGGLLGAAGAACPDGSVWRAAGGTDGDGGLHLGGRSRLRLEPVARRGGGCGPASTSTASPGVGRDALRGLRRPPPARPVAGRRVRRRFEARGRVDLVQRCTAAQMGTDHLRLWDGHPSWTRPALRWKVATGDEVWSSPVVSADGTVYIGNNGNHVRAITSDGEVARQDRPRWDLFASPAWVRTGPSAWAPTGGASSRSGRVAGGRRGSVATVQGGPPRRGHACGEQDWSCTAGRGDLGLCNGLDDDADGQVDEGAACLRLRNLEPRPPGRGVRLLRPDLRRGLRRRGVHPAAASHRR